MTSDQIIVQAPLSFTGSAKRLWRKSENVLVRWLILLPLILIAWLVVACWYVLFGLWLVPYRLVRRSQRNGRKSDLRHAETLAALKEAQR